MFCVVGRGKHWLGTSIACGRVGNPSRKIVFAYPIHGNSCGDFGRCNVPDDEFALVGNTDCAVDGVHFHRNVCRIWFDGESKIAQPALDKRDGGCKTKCLHGGGDVWRLGDLSIAPRRIFPVWEIYGGVGVRARLPCVVCGVGGSGFTVDL